MTHACPICTTPTDVKLADNSPYWRCPLCACGFQDPMPPKVYFGPDEPDVGGLSEQDIAINQGLAEHLCDVVMRGRPIHYALDIGSKIPVLANSLGGLIKGHVDVMDPMGSTPLWGELIRADFESHKVSAMRGDRMGDEQPLYDLITLVHCFEHFYDPLAALRKLRLMVSEPGLVFMRLPDASVPGWERDITPHHFAIHPFYHSFTSILEALAHSPTFVVESRVPMAGYGQSDIVLRPITRRPTIAVAMIVKNEERDLPRCMRSLDTVADSFAIVDTGSTDKTPAIAMSVLPDTKVTTASFLGASKQDESGDWKLWDFSAARNHSLQIAETQGDWVLWADADDEFKTPAAVRRAVYWDEHDVYGVWIDGGGARWVQQRMWKSHKKVRFQGRCHEYPTLDGLSGGQIDEALIVHHADPDPKQENSNPRNLRILALEWEEKQTARTAFYMANTYRDVGRHAEAVEWYRKRLAFRDSYRDELLFSYLYLARALRALERHDEADAVSREAQAMAPDWAEFTMELATGAYTRKEYGEAILRAHAVGPRAAIPPTALWREHGQYRDQPARLISWCREHMGETASAIAWADIAAQLIGAPDAEWDARRMRLMARFQSEQAPKREAPAIVKGLRQKIALHRPGAIGDILMTLNLVPALKAANPDADVHYFCSAGLAQPDALGSIILAAGCDAVMDCAGLDSWRKQYDRVVDLVGYPLAEGYPEKPMAAHLLQYFGQEMGLFLTGGLPALTLARPPTSGIHFLVPGNYVTLQRKAGWSSYKEWPHDRWQKVMDALGNVGIDVALVEQDAHGTPLSNAIALFANARMHLGIDSFCNHLTNYFWQGAQGGRRVPGVILWGSTQASAAGYAHNTNISKGLHCQPCFRESPKISRMPRDPCTVGSKVYGDGLHQCMQDISVSEVVAAALELWERSA